MRLRFWAPREEPAYSVKQPTNGEYHIPPAVWRKYVQIEAAMENEQMYRIHELQVSLVKAGFEAPTKLSEIDPIRKRLKERQQHFEKGLR